MSNALRPKQTLVEWLKSLGIASEVDRLHTLKRLDLSNKGLSFIHDEIGSLTSLNYLNLSNNVLTRLPDSIVELKMLATLNVRRNKLVALPQSLGTLPLSSLNISANKIETLSMLSMCTTLRTLDASSNFLHSVQGVFDAMPHLRSMNLEGNLLSEVSFTKGSLKELEQLNISHNRLKSLPTNVHMLEALTRLVAANNSIESSLHALEALDLQTLDLSGNKLNRLTLKGFDELELLCLDDNPLEQVECDPSFALRLKSFSAEGCHLSSFIELPSQKLDYISLSSNDIQALPQTLVYPRLEELDIDHNALTQLPESFFALSSLKALYIEGNLLDKSCKQKVESMGIEYCDMFVKKDIIIRIAQFDDLKAMAELLAQLFAIESDFNYDFEKHYRAFKMMFEDQGSDLIVAKHKNKVIGMVTMQSLVSSAEGGHAGLLEDLVVDTAFRKMGVGTRLVRKIFDIARDREYVRIQLAADKANEKALRFYRQRGFNLSNLIVYHYVGV